MEKMDKVEKSDQIWQNGQNSKENYKIRKKKLQNKKRKN